MTPGLEVALPAGVAAGRRGAPVWRVTDYLKLLRPRGFAAAGLFVLTGYAASPRARTGTAREVASDVALLLGAYVIGISGGTLLFNSACDRDDGPVNFLDDPPAPPPHLAVVGVVVMLTGALASFARGAVAGCVALTLVLLSCLYSHGLGRRRWKDVPFADWAVNAVGYGALTITLGALVGGAGPSLMLALIGAAFSLSIGGTFPATQLFQLREGSGDAATNFASRLGPERALRFCAVSLALALPLALGALIATGALASPAALALGGTFAACFALAIVRSHRWARAPFVDAKRELSRLLVLVLTARIAFIAALLAAPAG